MALQRAGRQPQDLRGAAAAQGELGRIVAKVDWLCVMGFALVQAWTVLCIALPDPVTYGEPYRDLRWLSLATACALSLAAVLWSPLGNLVARSRTAFAVVGVCSSIASLAGPVSALFAEPFSTVIIYAAAIGVGAGFALLYVAWYARFCAARDMMGLAFSVVGSLLFVYPLANVLSTDQVSPWISAVVGSLLPVLSVGCACAMPARPARAASPGASSVQAPASTTDHKDARRLCLRFCLCLFAVVLVVETMRNLLLGGTAIAFYSGVANLAGVVFKIAGAAWLIAVFARRDARGVSVAYRVAFLLLGGVVLCVPLLLQGNWLAHMLLDVGSFFFQMVVLMVLYQMSVGFQIAPVRAFGTARALWAAGTLAGIGMEHLRGMWGADLAQLLPVMLGLVAGVAFVFVFTDRDCVEILASMPAPEGAPSLAHRVAQLGERCGLSERELEVVVLAAQGRSAARIADSLGVSLATVNSHVHHVYQKLGVHSRQELLDLVEREGTQI